MRSFAYDEAGFFSADGAPAEIAEKRRLGFNALAESFEKQFPKTLRAAETFLNGISDLRFTDTNRVPFPFQKLVRERLNQAHLLTSQTLAQTIDDFDAMLRHELDVSQASSK